MQTQKIDIRKLRAVIFDLDDTLYDLTSEHSRTMAVFSKVAAPVFNLTPDQFCKEVAQTLREQIALNPGPGFHSRSIRFMKMLERRGLPLGQAAGLAEAYWREFFSGLKPFPGAIELLDALRSAGIRTGIGTDCSAWPQLRKLSVLGLADKIDFMVTSEEVGEEKPSPAFFNLVLEKAGCMREECMFVGDNLAKDAAGACNAGMKGVWIPYPDRNTDSDPGLAFVFSSLSELHQALFA